MSDNLSDEYEHRVHQSVAPLGLDLVEKVPVDLKLSLIELHFQLRYEVITQGNSLRKPSRDNEPKRVDAKDLKRLPCRFDESGEVNQPFLVSVVEAFKCFGEQVWHLLEEWEWKLVIAKVLHFLDFEELDGWWHILLPKHDPLDVRS